MKRAKDWGDNAYPEEERKRNDRGFYNVDAVSLISVALVFQILPRIGHRDLSIPAVVFLVGLHFFPMLPLHRHTANLVMGACLMIWAVLCPVMSHGDAMIGFVTGGAGLMLWISALWALRTASRLIADVARNVPA